MAHWCAPPSVQQGRMWVQNWVAQYPPLGYYKMIVQRYADLTVQWLILPQGCGYTVGGHMKIQNQQIEDVSCLNTLFITLLPFISMHHFTKVQFQATPGNDQCSGHCIKWAPQRWWYP